MSMFLSLEPFCIAFANVERFLFFEDADDDILGTTGMGILLLVDRVVLVLVVVVVVVVVVVISLLLLMSTSRIFLSSSTKSCSCSSSTKTTFFPFVFSFNTIRNLHVAYKKKKKINLKISSEMFKTKTHSYICFDVFLQSVWVYKGGKAHLTIVKVNIISIGVSLFTRLF